MLSRLEYQQENHIYSREAVVRSTEKDCEWKTKSEEGLNVD